MKRDFVCSVCQFMKIDWPGTVIEMQWQSDDLLWKCPECGSIESKALPKKNVIENKHLTK